MYTAYKQKIKKRFPEIIIQGDDFMLELDGMEYYVGHASSELHPDVILNSINAAKDIHAGKTEFDQEEKKRAKEEKLHNKNVPAAIQELSTEAIRELICSLKNTVWDEEHLLRKVATQIHGEDNVLTMVSLAVPLAMELEWRTRGMNFPAAG